MGLVLQFQRRALEDVVLDKNKKSRNKFPTDNVRYFLENGEELFLLGVSEGVGTCSDAHEIFIGVLSTTPVQRIDRYRNTSVFCAGFAILRNPTREEWDESNMPCMMVEGLKVKSVNIGPIVLARNGKKKLYACV